MFKKTMLICTTALLANVANAEVILDDWGTSTYVASFDDCPSYCTGNYEFTEEGGFDQYSSSSELDNDAGAGKAFAEVNGAGYTPVLKAIASANAGTGIYANAWGVQHYKYTGTESTIIELTLNLHGSISGEGKIRGDIAVIKGNNLPWTSDMGTLIYEMVPYEDVLANDSLFINSGDNQTTTSVVSIALEAGDSFFVRADLKASGQRASTADAYNTFTMNFSDDSELTATAKPADSGNDQYETYLQIVKELWTVAYEDNKFTRREKRTVRRVAKLLNLNPGDARMLKREVKQEANAL